MGANKAFYKTQLEELGTELQTLNVPAHVEKEIVSRLTLFRNFVQQAVRGNPNAINEHEQLLRGWLVKAGFEVTASEAQVNGHAPFHTMPPWFAFTVAGGHVIRMGYLVSCVHIDYKYTPCKEDLLPEKPERTRGTQCIEVNENEVPRCLGRLFDGTYRRPKSE